MNNQITIVDCAVGDPQHGYVIRIGKELNPSQRIAHYLTKNAQSSEIVVYKTFLEAWNAAYAEQQRNGTSWSLRADCTLS